MRGALGTICLGLCVQLYFFFWTATLLGIGAYFGVRGMAWLRDREGGGERRELRFGAVVLAGGIVLGAPQVYDNARTFAEPKYQPILQRMIRGQKLPPGDPQRTIHLKNTWTLAELAVGARRSWTRALERRPPWFMPCPATC